MLGSGKPIELIEVLLTRLVFNLEKKPIIFF